MYSVMIVEDEVHILKHMQKMLSAFGEFQVKGVFLTPEEALAVFAYMQPDVVFLDIEMPRMNGIELARRMLDQKYDLHIVFTTAYGHYALDAFGVEAIDYLMKPIMNEDIERVIKRLDKAMGRPSPKKQAQDVSVPPVRCFGCFDVRDRQHQIVKWPTRKAEELFAYFLIHQGEYISKWELLDVFWPDIDEERGLHNLYNTIYRIKQVLKNLPLSPQIQKINDGYVLEAKENLSDLGQLLELMKKEKEVNFSSEAAVRLFFLYATPLFGTRDYFWSLSLQHSVAQGYKRLCRRLLNHYREQNQFHKGAEVIRHYVVQHMEDEGMMEEWLNLVAGWPGHEEKIVEYRIWFNENLKDAELPLLE